MGHPSAPLPSHPQLLLLFSNQSEWDGERQSWEGGAAPCLAASYHRKAAGQEVPSHTAWRILLGSSSEEDHTICWQTSVFLWWGEVMEVCQPLPHDPLPCWSPPTTAVSVHERRKSCPGCPRHCLPMVPEEFAPALWVLFGIACWCLVPYFKKKKKKLLEWFWKVKWMFWKNIKNLAM